MSTTVDILCFIRDLNFANHTNCQSLKAVDRSNETKIQVIEHLN